MLSTAPDGVLSDADARAWIVRLLDRVDAGDAHAFCETDDAPAEVLSAAWLGFGPPPPPGDDGDEGAERSVREAPTSGPACWLRLERALGRCARCADAYHRRVDAWNDEADLEDGLGGDEDAAVLAALLRERADARLVSRARDVRATLEKRTRERDPRSDRDTTPPDVLHAFLAVCREALAVPGCSRAPPETFDAVGAAVVAAERAPDAFDALLASRVGRADATERRAGLLRLLAHPSSEIRRVARRLFEGGRRVGGDVSARDGEASSRRRFVERVSEESAEAVDEWAATAWDAFAERQRRIREDEDASDDSRDASRNALRAAWEALAIATARMRPSARAETLARRPETLAAALDDIGGSDDAVVALAARCVAELVGGGGDVGWDSAGIPPATAVDVLEAAARKSPNETTHLAVVAAMGATLASASTARGATESNDDAYDGTNRASAFLCRVAPNSPHLFSDVVAWEARRAAVDAFRAGYLVARPSTKDHTRLATIRAMEVSARGDTRVGSGSATSVDASRIAARRSAAAAVAVMIRADAAALAALERRAAGCADDDDEDASRRGSPDDAWDVLEFAAFQWEDGDPSDGEASAVGTASRVASREATAAAFSARLVATSERAWRPSLEAYAETYAPGTTRPAGALHALADDPATVHAALVAAAELASSPPPNSRASRVRFGVDPDASSRDATRLAEHLAGFIRRLAESSGPLARARAPFEAIRAAVAAAMGTRETLRAAARAALRTQALGAGTREFGPRVWASVCAVPEATLAALRGATDAARNAATLADPADLLAAAAPALFFGAAVARAAEAAAFKSPESQASTESAASAIRKLRDASWSLARRVVAESSRFAADGWAQGDLVRALQSIPATFSSRRRRPKPAEGEGDFLADLVAWGGAPLTSASARHWADATDACVADASPAAREAARDAARMTLANLAGGAAPPPSSARNAYRDSPRSSRKTRRGTSDAVRSKSYRRKWTRRRRLRYRRRRRPSRGRRCRFRFRRREGPRSRRNSRRNTRRISGVRFAIVWRRARRRLRSRLPEVSGRIPSTRGTVIAVDSPGTRRMTTSRTSATLAATTTTSSSRCLKNRRRNRSGAAWAGRSATARDGTGTRRARPFRGASARPANAHRTNARRSSLARARRVAFVQTRIFWRTFARAGRRIHASTRFRFSETSNTRNARNSRPFARTPIATRSFASARLLRRSARRSANAPRRRARNAPPNDFVRASSISIARTGPRRRRARRRRRTRRRRRRNGGRVSCH